MVLVEKQDGDAKISPRAKVMAEKLGIAYEQIQGSGPHGRIIAQDVDAASETLPKMTPLAQEKAAAEGLAPVAKDATGLGGRVGASDLVSYNPVYSDDFEVKKTHEYPQVNCKSHAPVIAEFSSVNSPHER